MLATMRPAAPRSGLTGSGAPPRVLVRGVPRVGGASAGAAVRRSRAGGAAGGADSAVGCPMSGTAAAGTADGRCPSDSVARRGLLGRHRGRHRDRTRAVHPVVGEELAPRGGHRRRDRPGTGRTCPRPARCSARTSECPAGSGRPIPTCSGCVTSAIRRSSLPATLLDTTVWNRRPTGGLDCACRALARAGRRGWCTAMSRLASTEWRRRGR